MSTLHQVHPNKFENGDVISIFSAAALRTSLWGEDCFRSVLNSAHERIPLSNLDWEEGDEEWGRIVVGERALLILHTKFPVAIVSANLGDSIFNLLDEHGIQHIVVSDFESKCLYASKSHLEAILGRALTDVIDYSNISASDLWWATV